MFSVWGSGFDAEGRILWDKEPTIEADRAVLPRVLTDIQEDGCALQFDGARQALCEDRGVRDRQGERLHPVQDVLAAPRRARRQ